MGTTKKITEQNGFKACPFCGRADELDVMTEDCFYRLQGEYDTACISVKCERCDVDLIDHSSSIKNYEKRLDILRRKWNKRAAVPQEKEEGEKVAENA